MMNMGINLLSILWRGKPIRYLILKGGIWFLISDILNLTSTSDNEAGHFSMLNKNLPYRDVCNVVNDNDAYEWVYVIHLDGVLEYLKEVNCKTLREYIILKFGNDVIRSIVGSEMCVYEFEDKPIRIFNTKEKNLNFWFIAGDICKIIKRHSTEPLIGIASLCHILSTTPYIEIADRMIRWFNFEVIPSLKKEEKDPISIKALNYMSELSENVMMLRMRKSL